MSTKLIPIVSFQRISQKDCYEHKVREAFICRHEVGISTLQWVWREYWVNMSLVSLCFLLLFQCLCLQRESYRGIFLLSLYNIYMFKRYIYVKALIGFNYGTSPLKRGRTLHTFLPLKLCPYKNSEFCITAVSLAQKTIS